MYCDLHANISIVNEFYMTSDERASHTIISVGKMEVDFILEKIRELFLTEPVIYRGSKTFIITIIDEDDQEFNMEFYHIDCYIPLWHSIAPTIKLFSLVIPESLRRSGMGTKIIQLLQEEGKRKCRCLVVGPALSNEMTKLLDKTGFTPRNILDYFYVDPCFVPK